MAYKFNPFTGTLDDAGTVSALNVLGTVANAAALPGGATIGDVYQTIDTGVFYVWDGSAWDSLGTLAGPAGVVAATAPITYNSGTQTVSTSMATNRLLGRSTAGTGVAEEISVGTGLSLSGGTLSATGGGGGSGDITSVTAGTGLSGGGTSGDVTLNLADTTVTPASYTNASITVDAQGRITSASSGTAPVTSVSATGPISSTGGTTPTISTSMATNRLLGRSTAGTGVAEEISVGTGLSLSGGTLSATGGGGSGTPGGSDTQVQFNDGGSFGGDSGLTFNKTTNLLTVGASTGDGGQAKVFGDINLDDGGTYTTTVQCVTPTANRTISFPDATGTVGLVAGSSGQLLWNNAGANAGVTGSVADSSGNVTLGGLTTLSGSPTANGTSSLIQSNVAVTGAWRTGASSNNPALLLNPTGTTPSTTWSTSGTGLGVNAPSGFVGRIADFQINGTSAFSFDAANRRFYLGSNDYAYLDVSADGYVVALTNRYGAGSKIIFKEDITISNPTRGILLGDQTYAPGIRLGTFTSPPTQVRFLNAANPTSTIWLFGKYGGNYAASTNFHNGTGVSVWCGYGAQPTDANANGGNAGNFDVWLNAGGAGAGTGVAGANGRLRVMNDATDTEVFGIEQSGVVQIGGERLIANLPSSPTAGMITRVTDGDSGLTFGNTVVNSGAGATPYLVWYNGTNWTVIGA